MEQINEGNSCLLRTSAPLFFCRPARQAVWGRCSCATHHHWNNAAAALKTTTVALHARLKSCGAQSVKWSDGVLSSLSSSYGCEQILDKHQKRGGSICPRCVRGENTQLWNAIVDSNWIHLSVWRSIIAMLTPSAGRSVISALSQLLGGQNHFFDFCRGVVRCLKWDWAEKWGKCGVPNAIHLFPAAAFLTSF